MVGWLTGWLDERTEKTARAEIGGLVLTSRGLRSDCGQRRKLVAVSALPEVGGVQVAGWQARRRAVETSASEYNK